MNRFLFAFFILALAKHTHGYHYDQPHVKFPLEDRRPQTSASQAVKFGTQIIKGNNGKSYEVTMSPSNKIYEKRMPPNEQVFIVQHINQQTTGSTAYQQTQQAYVYQPPNANSLTSRELNAHFQQPFNNQQENFNFNSNQRNGIFAANNAQNNYNQFTANSNYQQQQLQLQQQVTRAEQLPHTQTLIISQRPQQQQAAYSQATQRQQQYYPQQYEHYLQQPLSNNNLPNSNNLLNDLVNNQKYVSQSEASQLDVYPFKQVNGNPRPFTRTITKCDSAGQCEPQNAAVGGSDFHHQQVLKQSKAQIEQIADKCQNKFNYQFTGNALTNDVAKAQRGIPIYKGTDLKDRRLFPYSEVVIDQYPHN